jgi:hypothetical protein
VNLIDRTRAKSALMSSGTAEREPTIMRPSFDRRCSRHWRHGGLLPPVADAKIDNAILVVVVI